MKNIKEEIINLESELPNVCCQIDEYTNEYVDDRIHDIADSNVDVYYSGLLDWISENRGEAVEYIEDSVAEFGIDSNNFNFWKLLQSGQYLMYERELYDNKKETLLLWALNYIKEEKNIEELEDDVFEEIEDIDFDKFDKFSEIENEIDNILDKGEDDE
jgi:hypothetical protein